MPRNIIGEGAYGCVHKPSLHCKTPPSPHFNYRNYVSKIMKTKHARKELNEFITIHRIDPTNEFHLGNPIMCSPDLTKKSVRRDIENCERIQVTDETNKAEQLSLLLVKYGGPDLKSLCVRYLADYLKTDAEEKTDKFLLEIHHLLRGIKCFRDNGLVHNDIKPQNLLFDLSNGKMKYIDFGLMRTKEAIIEASKQGNNDLGIFHWSFPFDCGFMNKPFFEKYSRLTENEKTHLCGDLLDMLLYCGFKNTFGMPIKDPDSFDTLFTYLGPNGKPDVSVREDYIFDFFDGFNEFISKTSYNNVLEHSINSIDIFGLGMSLQYIINCFKKNGGLKSEETFVRLSAFFKKMHTFNPLERVVDINALIDEYEGLLLEIGVLIRLNKRFKNHKPVKGVSTNKKATNKPVVIEDNERIEIVVKCPPEKEFNPNTTRCVKKCKQGYSRNPEFKCRKTRKIRKANKKKTSPSPKTKPNSKDEKTIVV